MAEGRTRDGHIRKGYRLTKAGRVVKAKAKRHRKHRR